jgi:hypothetical protein
MTPTFLLGMILMIDPAIPASDLQSGPQVGATVPGQFLPLNINGPNSGEEFCLYCNYGNAPVLMIFAAKPSDSLAKLVAELEKVALAAPADADFGACVIVTDTSRETKVWLSKLAFDKNLKKVVLATVGAEKVKDYALSPKADVTALLYSNRVVRVNRSFAPGEIKGKALTDLMADARKHLGLK